MGCAQEVMLRRLKRDVMAELPPKRRQVVRLPRPRPSDWPNQEIPEGVFYDSGCAEPACDLLSTRTPAMLQQTLAVTNCTP